jgi:hypothetical protein
MINREQLRVALANAVLNAASRMTSSLLTVRIGLDKWPPGARNGTIIVRDLSDPEKISII